MFNKCSVSGSGHKLLGDVVPEVPKAPPSGQVARPTRDNTTTRHFEVYRMQLRRSWVQVRIAQEHGRDPVGLLLINAPGSGDLRFGRIPVATALPSNNRM